MYGRHAWAHEDIRWHHAFPDLLHDDEDSVTHIDYRKFDDVIPLEGADGGGPAGSS